VRVTPSTKFRCGNRTFNLSDLRANELVTVEGGYREDGSVEATKVTVRRQKSDCSSASVLSNAGVSGKTEPKLLIGVLVDTSGHQRNVIEFERGALRAIAELFSGLAAESFINSYGGNVQELQGWSPLEAQLKWSSAQISLDVDQGTRLYDAINEALLKSAARSDSDLKVLIVIGEGNDAGSSARYLNVKTMAISGHVQCFALLVADHNLRAGRVRHYGWYLDDLATATNGAGYDIERSQRNLNKALHDVLRRIDQHSASTSF